MENEQRAESEKTLDDNQFGTKKADLSQGGLIKQWREALACLKKDVEFDSIAKKEGDNQDQQLMGVLEDIAYLDKKNTLLDENDDFVFSDSGFLKYQTKHMSVFDYLSQLTKPIATDSKSKFYFVSRSKQIEQQLKPSNGKHSFVHFLFIPVVVLVLFIAGVLIVKQTQHNSIVNVLLFLFCSFHLKAATQLLKPFKKTAATPFKFRVSLLGIHSLNTLLKVIFLCFIPIVVTAVYRHYWIDDVIIISLAILCLFHYRADNEQTEQTTSIDSTEKEPANV